MGWDMSGLRTEAPIVRLSARLYELLLVVYPESFRIEYGPHMLQVFRDCTLRAHNEEGTIGLISLWALTLLDWLRSVVEQHLEKETLVTKDTLVRLSGWAMMIGGAASSLGFIYLVLSEGSILRRSSVWEAVFVIAFFYGPIGVGLGLLGLRARYGKAISMIGKPAMLLGALLGSILVLVGDVVQSLPNDLADNGFGIFTVGLFIIFITLELYGILAILRNPQERWNGLAAVAGLPVTVIALIVAMTLGVSEPRPLTLGIAVLSISLLAIMGVSLAMLGYQLQAETPERISAEVEAA
jgi:hypothetical protein